MNEKEKMKLGLWYDANYDENLLKERDKAEELYFSFNHTNPKDKEKREEILNTLLPNKGNNVTILSPFYTDYGYNCYIGKDTFINHNAYLMDGATIHIGEHCFIGPNCGIYTGKHPLIFEERNKGFEKALPIIIEDHVWIGADVTILAGVHIGKGSVIGAKSLVTKDIPAGVIAYGSPCKVIRNITKEDTIERDIYEI